MAVTSTRRTVVRPGLGSRPDDLAVEAPLGLVLDRAVIAVLMRTPGHDVELAAGWLVVESGARTPADVITLRECHDDGSEVRMVLAEGVRPPRPRAFLTSSSCGVCSADAIDLAPQRSSDPSSPGWTVARSVLVDLPDAMRASQRTFARTGSVHAAALAASSGEVLVVREDVGRHNAVDKVVGWALLGGRLPLTDSLLVVSGRVSFEIVQKAVASGVAGIVAVSAPTDLAVDLAREYGLVLAGLVRDGRLNLYAGAERVV